MEKNSTVISLILIALFFCFSVYGQEKEESKVLQWKKVDGAFSYLVEIKKATEKFLRLKAAKILYIWTFLLENMFLIFLFLINSVKKLQKPDGKN